MNIQNYYTPRFLVTQKEYDTASAKERAYYNYVVDEALLSLPVKVSIRPEPLK